MDRLILDSGVLIALERGSVVSRDVVPDDADVALAAITASELLVGVELADAGHRVTRQQTVTAIVETFDALPFDVRLTHRQQAAP